MGVGDILFILFRHKWKILILGLMGLAAAAAIYKLYPKAYASQARLFVRYVQEERHRSSIRD